MQPGEATEESSAGELRRSFPAGNGVGSVRVGCAGEIGGMVLEERVEYGVERGFLLDDGGAFPVEAESLTADVALDVLFDVRLSDQNLHGNWPFQETTVEVLSHECAAGKRWVVAQQYREPFPE